MIKTRFNENYLQARDYFMRKLNIDLPDALRIMAARDALYAAEVTAMFTDGGDRDFKARDLQCLQVLEGLLKEAGWGLSISAGPLHYSIGRLREDMSTVGCERIPKAFPLYDIRVPLAWRSVILTSTAPYTASYLPTQRPVEVFDDWSWTHVPESLSNVGGTWDPARRVWTGMDPEIDFWEYATRQVDNEDYPVPVGGGWCETLDKVAISQMVNKKPDA